MKRLFRLLALAALAPVLAACDDDGATGPGAESSTIAVRAYVDANGTGAYDSGDVPLSGATVTLTSAATTLTETTGSDGLATFEGVPAGSYAATFSGDVPAGALLAGASSPIVVAPAFGAALDAEFRYVYQPGRISGTLFRDENANDVFDEGVDTPAPGIPVALFLAGQTGGEPLAETTTDAAGAYSFDTLRPGSYTVVFSPFPTMTLVGGTTRDFTVGPGATTPANVTFTGNLLSPISAARAAAVAGERTVMAVKGVASWQPSFSDELFLQDETAGILVFLGSGGRNLGIEPGDTVIIVGTTQLRFGEVQLTSVSTVSIEGSGPVPAGRPTSATQINAGQFGHELVTIEGATVTNVETLSFGNQFVTLTDAGGNAFGVYADSRTGVTATTWTVGGLYDVTGVVGYDSRFAFPNRIEVRGPGDVVAGEAPSTIAEARALLAGDTVLVQGIVTFKEPWNSRVYFFQDATGGISTFDGGRVLSEEVQIGDRIRVRGVLGAFNGEIQLASILEGVILGSPGAPAPTDVTSAQINAGDFQGMLVRVSGTVQEIIQVNSFGTHRVRVRDAAGTDFWVFVDNRTGVAMSAWSVGQVVTLTGVLGTDTRDTPPYRLEIRSAADIQ